MNIHPKRGKNIGEKGKRERQDTIPSFARNYMQG